MSVMGIICEYNPIHEGHRQMMAQLRRQGAEAIVCAMSGSFVQRGEAAVVNKLSRAEMAVRCGADLVLELPTAWSCATAETFARGGVQLLADTGVVTHLAFGSECGEIAPLQQVAALLNQPVFYEAIRREMQSGISYAAARQRAVQQTLGAPADILSQPNNILGVEYLKALAQERSTMIPVTVPRMGAAHDGEVSHGIASASHLRGLLREGRQQEALALMPEEAAAVLQRELDAGRAPTDMTLCDRAILAKLRGMSEEELARYDGGGEGLYHRVYRAARQATSVEELCQLAKTKRYSHARLRRMVLSCWLERQEPLDRPPYLRLLAANATGRSLLRRMKENGTKVLTKPADVAQLGQEAAVYFAKESRYTDLYTLTYPNVHESVCDSDWRMTPVML